MGARKVGVRELKARFSEYLREVKAGQTIVITEHGRPVGRIVPAEQPLQKRLDGMLNSGLIAWSGKKIETVGPMPRVRGRRTVADLLVESRD